VVGIRRQDAFEPFEGGAVVLSFKVDTAELEARLGVGGFKTSGIGEQGKLLIKGGRQQPADIVLEGIESNGGVIIEETLLFPSGLGFEKGQETPGETGLEAGEVLDRTGFLDGRHPVKPAGIKDFSLDADLAQ